MQVIQCPVCHNPDYVEGNVSIAKKPHKPIKPQESALDCRSRWACQKAEGTPIFSSWTCNTKEGCGNEEKAYQNGVSSDYGHLLKCPVGALWAVLFLQKMFGRFQIKKLKCAQQSSHPCCGQARGRNQCQESCTWWERSDRSGLMQDPVLNVSQLRDALARMGFLAVFIGL